MALTPEQFEKLKLRLSNQGAIDFSGAGSQSMPIKSGSDFGSRVKADLAERSQNVANIRTKTDSGAESKASGVLQSAGQVAGLVGDVGFEVTKSVSDAISPKIGEVTSEFVKNVAGTEPAQKALQAYESLKKSNPEAVANLEAVFNIASLLPALKGGQVAGKTGATIAGKSIELAGTAVENAGRAGSGVGSAFYKSAITPTVGEAEKILNYQAKAPFSQRLKSAVTGSPIYDERGQIVSAPVTRAQTALEKGIAGGQKGVGIQARRESQKLYKNVIEPAVSSSDARVTKEELFRPIIERIENTKEPGRKKALQDAFEAIQDDYKDINDYSLKEAQEVKRGLDEFTPEKVFRGKSVANEYRMLQNDMANAIRQKTYESLKDQNIRKSYIDYGNLKELEKVGVKAISEVGTKGGFGTFWSSMWDTATTPVRTIGGQVLYRVGNKVEFVGKKGIKNFGQYLRQKGYARPKN